MVLNDVLEVIAETARFSGRQDMLRWFATNPVAEAQWVEVVRGISKHFGPYGTAGFLAAPQPLGISAIGGISSLDGITGSPGLAGYNALVGTQSGLTVAQQVIKTLDKTTQITKEN